MSLTPSQDRIHIAILGRMNAGKSTLLNLLTQSNASIADATPGTTADAKVAFMQIHGVGPARLFDCAGMDELGALGAKKLHKTLNIARRSDVILHVLDAEKAAGGDLSAHAIQAYGDRLCGRKSVPVEELVRSFGGRVLTVLNAKNGLPGPAGMYERRSYGPLLRADLHSLGSRDLARFIAESAPARNFRFLQGSALVPAGVLPRQRVLLVCPLDAEAPKQRLLRPQAMALEAFLAHRNDVEIANPDCAALRAGDSAEHARLQEAVARADFVLSDSQIIDVVASKARREQPISTFSIQQIKYLAGEHFQYLVDSLRAFDEFAARAAQKTGKKPRVLIAEACTHDRLTEICEDIGTRQIPALIKQKLGGEVVFSFGKDDEIIESEKIDLAVHCGGCMISKQQMQQRIAALKRRGIPCTNYGMLLMWARGGDVSRLIDVWR